MIRRFIALLVMVLPLASMAQDGPRHITDGDVLRGSFEETRVLKDFSAPLKSQGHFVIAPHYGLLWMTQKPFAVTTVIQPSGIVQLVDGNETTRLSSERMPFMMRLYTMLSGTLAGDWKPLAGDFIVASSRTKIGWAMELTPRKADDPTLPFTMIHVTGSRFVERVVMDKHNGESDTLVFTKQILSSLPLSPEEQASFMRGAP